MKKMKGFTLIELLIVVAIIAILAAIAIPNFLEAQVRSKVSRCKADMRTIATGLESYRVDGNAYPPMFDVGTGGTWGILVEPPFHARIPSYLTTPTAYLTSLPHDPFIDYEQYLDWAPPEISHRFVYFNYPYFFQSAIDGPALRNRADDAGLWLFYSPGPDRLWYNEPANLVYLNYDPTNGTVSLGNIFRTQRTTDKYERGTW